ncbi:hypothetical protein [Sphingomonas olei]|uniref:EF-hand domain-containing protein n=1 Tax=Sphingomonas olei TaxID=1886787 RepID=A0ABY2QIE2_9SPHN|nr:hypothetical protein [Sphingomonas olei]THG40580.1 hypothetical protein E5988_07085 [Sphingomonas olei]
MKRFIFAAALAGTAISGAAIAQTAAPTAAAQRGPGAADTNRDGVVTRAEALAAADARFDRLDADKNGKLTAGEHRGRRGGAEAEVTREQFRERAGQRFDRMDANKDGRIDAAERQAMRDKWKGKRGGRHGGGGMGMMMGADANRDGVLTKAEAVAAAGAMFDRVDTNRDGRIDAAERQAARGAMKMRGAPNVEARPAR